MIRILQFGLSDKLGGIETYLFKLAKNIDRNKFKFDFLILGNSEPCFYEEFTELGCEFHFVPDRRNNPWANYREISSLLEKEQYDIIHCNLNSLSYITPVLLAVKKNIPTIVHSRNAGIPTSIKSRFLHKINYNRLPKDKVTLLSVSDYAGDWMFGKKTDVKVINNGIDVEKYRFNETSRSNIRHEFNIKESESLIIHTGAFREQKNHGFIIDIYNEVYKNNNNVKLMLVGSGNLKDDIKNKVSRLGLEQSVIFTGNRNDISSLLSAADLFLFPSLYEGFPNSVIEAETSGLPCIISDTITKEVIIDNYCKQISLKESPGYWAKNIEYILNEKVPSRNTAADKVKLAGFSVDSEINNIEQIYLNSLNVKTR